MLYFKHYTLYIIHFFYSVWYTAYSLLNKVYRMPYYTVCNINNTVQGIDVTFFGSAGLVYWDLTLPMFVLQLRNIVYDTPLGYFGLAAMKEIPLYQSVMTKE